jgi:trehalose 6-phosphate phosphatase
VKDLLARANLELLARLAGTRALLAFDFDGTLAPLHPDREAAAMRARTRTLMVRLAERFPCAVISGRSRADTAARMAGVPLRHVVGNHGLEPGGDLSAAERVATRALAKVRPLLSRWRGVELEDKRYSFSLHYRRARPQAEVRDELMAMLAGLKMSLRVIPGKLVLNVVTARAPDKGHALVSLMARERAERALYIGDDVTDEDVFELHRRARRTLPWRSSNSEVLTVRVGRSASSSASYFLRSQLQIDELLSRLATLRRKPAAP